MAVPQLDVAVVGGGPAGLACAYALTRAFKDIRVKVRWVHSMRPAPAVCVGAQLGSPTAGVRTVQRLQRVRGGYITRYQRPQVPPINRPYPVRGLSAFCLQRTAWQNDRQTGWVQESVWLPHKSFTGLQCSWQYSLRTMPDLCDSFGPGNDQNRSQTQSTRSNAQRYMDDYGIKTGLIDWYEIIQASIIYRPSGLLLRHLPCFWSWSW